MSGSDAWEYLVDPPDDGWLWLPEKDEDVDAWVGAVCTDLAVKRRHRRAFTHQLRAFALAYRRLDADLGAVWVPDPAYGVLAAVSADRYQRDRSLDQLADELAREAGAAQVSRVGLPAGPAVRVRQLDARRGVAAGEAPVESVTHLVAPEAVVDAAGSPVLIELVTTWTLLAQGDDLAALADDVAAGLRIDRH